MVQIFNERTDALVTSLSLHADGKTRVCVLDKLHLVTLDIIAKVMGSVKSDFMICPLNCTVKM